MKKPERSRKTIILQYSICFAVCAVIIFIWLCVAGIFEDYRTVIAKTHWNIRNEANKNYFILTNAFFGVGVIAAGLGFFVVASNGGAYEMLFYGVRRFISLFQKNHNKFPFHTYYDYHEYRSGQPASSYGFLLVTGIFYTAISMIFMMLYLNS